MTHMRLHENALPLSEQQLDAYLARIGMTQPKTPDLETLTALHRAHLMTFTFEGLDAFMGWPNRIAPSAAFTKMVEGRRGGWCFEMNGLFGAALAALGFRVTRLCGGVNRATLGDMAIGNHLTLRVDLDRPYLAEVGVADAIIAPVAMEVGTISQRGFDFAIESVEEDWLRFRNHPQGTAQSFDFKSDHVDETALAAAHGWLIQDPASPFTNALAVFRHTEEGYFSLQNDRLRHVTPTAVTERKLESKADLGEVFETIFDLEVPQLEAVWDRVAAAAKKAAS